MKLTVLGKYGAFPPPGGATSGYLIKGEVGQVLLEMGSGVLSRLQRYVSPIKLDAVILTHLHFDHISDILPFSYCLSALGKKMKIYCPFTPGPVLELLKSIKVFKLIDITKIESAEIGGMFFEFMQMTHSIVSYAVKISEKGNILVYSGDTTFTKKLVDFSFDANFLLMDVGKTEGAQSHMNIFEAAFIGKSVKAKVFATHIPYNVQLAKIDGVEIVEEGETYLIED